MRRDVAQVAEKILKNKVNKMEPRQSYESHKTFAMTGNEWAASDRGAWRGEVRGRDWNVAANDRLAMQILISFLFWLQKWKKKYEPEVARNQKKAIVGCLFSLSLSLFLYVSFCLPQALIFMPLIGANYAGIKGRGLGQSVMQHLWVRKEMVVSEPP